MLFLCGSRSKGEALLDCCSMVLFLFSIYGRMNILEYFLGAIMAVIMTMKTKGDDK